MTDSRQTGTSLLDFFGPVAVTNARECLHRALMCSRLAKLSVGTLQRKLYRLKHQNIRAAIALEHSALVIRVDHDRYWGLISIALLADRRVSLHTHENWITAA